MRRINPKPRMKFTQTSEGTGILDAGHGSGIVAGLTAMEHAIQLAKQTGIGAVAVKKSTHFGAAAVYGLLAANQGMIGIAVTHSSNYVRPYGRLKAFLGTNPICIAVPMKDEIPFVLDMATSAVALHKVKAAAKKGHKITLGWAIDSEGKPTTDPKAVGEGFGALEPLGSGYKGYGLGLVVEILCSCLAGAPFGIHQNKLFQGVADKQSLGHFFIAIDISRFRDIEEFMADMKTLADMLRAEQPATGFDSVPVAGDPQKEAYEDRRQKPEGDSAYAFRGYEIQKSCTGTGSLLPVMSYKKVFCIPALRIIPTLI